MRKKLISGLVGLLSLAGCDSDNGKNDNFYGNYNGNIIEKNQEVDNNEMIKLASKYVDTFFEYGQKLRESGRNGHDKLVRERDGRLSIYRKNLDSLVKNKYGDNTDGKTKLILMSEADKRIDKTIEDLWENKYSIKRDDLILDSYNGNVGNLNQGIYKNTVLDAFEKGDISKLDPEIASSVSEIPVYLWNKGAFRNYMRTGRAIDEENTKTRTYIDGLVMFKNWVDNK
jgi:hypothetical protein